MLCEYPTSTTNNLRLTVEGYTSAPSNNDCCEVLVEAVDEEELDALDGSDDGCLEGREFDDDEKLNIDEYEDDPYEDFYDDEIDDNNDDNELDLEEHVSSSPLSNDAFPSDHASLLSIIRSMLRKIRSLEEALQALSDLNTNNPTTSCVASATNIELNNDHQSRSSESLLPSSNTAWMSPGGGGGVVFDSPEKTTVNTNNNNNNNNAINNNVVATNVTNNGANVAATGGSCNINGVGGGRRMMMMVCTAKPTAASTSSVTSLIPLEEEDSKKSRQEIQSSRKASALKDETSDKDGLGDSNPSSKSSLLTTINNKMSDANNSPQGLNQNLSLDCQEHQSNSNGAATAATSAFSNATSLPHASLTPPTNGKTGNPRGGRSGGIQGVVWRPEENSWIAFWQDPTTGQQHVKRFLVSQYGGEGARKMAMKCRREADKQLSAAVTNGANGVRDSLQSQPPRSEVPGVYWYRNRNGWVAQWFENGKNKHKFFAASVFGVEGAKQKAIAYRLMKLEEKKLKGW